MAKETVVLEYVGRDQDGVQVKEPDGVTWSLPVPRGGTYETTADHAAALLTQEGEWKRVPSTRVKTTKEEENTDG